MKAIPKPSSARFNILAATRSLNVGTERLELSRAPGLCMLISCAFWYLALAVEHARTAVVVPVQAAILNFLLPHAGLWLAQLYTWLGRLRQTSRARAKKSFGRECAHDNRSREDAQENCSVGNVPLNHIVVWYRYQRDIPYTVIIGHIWACHQVAMGSATRALRRLKASSGCCHGVFMCAPSDFQAMGSNGVRHYMGQGRVKA